MATADDDATATRESEGIWLILGKPYQRIRYQQERRFRGVLRPEECHDCRAHAGELHMVGCDVEECPACHRQAISCGCDAFGTEVHRWTTFEEAAREMPEPAARYLLTLLRARLEASGKSEGSSTHWTAPTGRGWAEWWPSPAGCHSMRQFRYFPAFPRHGQAQRIHADLA